MKKISLLMLLVLLVSTLSGCGIAYNQKVDNFRDHFTFFADDPESYIDIAREYSIPCDLEEAIGDLCDYLYQEEDSSWADAVDAWMYVTLYIDALHAEIADLYEEYQDAY